MDIHQRIAALGVRVEFVADLPPGRLGEYRDDERLIRVRADLTHAQEIETLCHEYVHAYHQDRTCHPIAEHRARRQAALMIIDPRRYAFLESISLDPYFLARELETTLRVIEDFQLHLALSDPTQQLA